MSRFAGFIHDIQAAFWMVVVISVLYVLGALAGYDIKKSNFEARIHFYQLFTHEETPEFYASPEGKFVESVRHFFSSEKEMPVRMRAYDALHSEKLEPSFKTFNALTTERQMALVERNVSSIDVMLS